MTKEELNRIEEAWWSSKEGIIAMAEVFRLAEKGLDQQKICADCNTKMDEIRRAYDNMKKTADVQPVTHGEWLGTEYDGYSDGFPVYTTWKCSNCGAEFECEDMDFHYCPNCGAKMDKEQKNE